MPVCEKCGAEMLESARFCSECGAPSLQERVRVAREKRLAAEGRSTKAHRAFRFVLLGLILAVVVFGVWQWIDPGRPDLLKGLTTRGGPEPINTPVPIDTPTPTHESYQPQFSDVEPLACELDKFKATTFCTLSETARVEWFLLSFLPARIPVKVYVGIPGDEGSAPYLRWDIEYLGDGWIFFDEIIFLVDGKRYGLPVDEHEDVSRHVLDSGNVLENYDRKVNELSFLVKLVHARKIEVRLSGSGGHRDYVITGPEIDLIKRALATYEQHGGKLPLDKP